MVTNISEFKPTERFSGIVENYARYRPGYPGEIISILEEKYNMENGKVIGDIGSGTGIFSKLLIEAGYFVFCVEPNDEMRIYSENEFAGLQNFKSVKGTAEKTNLSSQSVDAITAAQSFHWFDTFPVIDEFNRILKPDGYIILIWNDRRSDNNDFMNQYEKLLTRYCPDYSETSHKNYSSDRINSIFSGYNIDFYQIENHQDLNLDAFLGRLKSCSYCLKKDHENYNLLMDEITTLHTAFQSNGIVRFEYDTIMYVISKKSE
jgi:SAM-dependent methyltransferase